MDEELVRFIDLRLPKYIHFSPLQSRFDTRITSFHTLRAYFGVPALSQSVHSSVFLSQRNLQSSDDYILLD